VSPRSCARSFPQPNLHLGDDPTARGHSDAGAKFPQVAELLEDAAEDVLAHLHFPREHRRRLHATNPPGRLQKEIKRRSRVVGIFPTRDSLCGW
jgi:putative transposase